MLPHSGRHGPCFNALMRAQRCFVGVGLALWLGAGCGGLSEKRDSAGMEPGRSSGMAGTGSGRLPPVSTTGTPIAVTPPTGTPMPGIPPSRPASRRPVKHRPEGVVCDNQRGAGSARACYYDEALPACSDAGACQPRADCPDCRAECVDCGDGTPRCVSGYGECLSDAECTAGVNGRCDDNRGDFFCTYDTCFADSTCTSGGPCACEGESGSPGNTCLPGNCQTDADCGGGYCSPTFGGCGTYSGVIAYYCHTAGDTCVDDGDCVDAMQGAGYCMYGPEQGRWSCGYGQCVG